MCLGNTYWGDKSLELTGNLGSPIKSNVIHPLDVISYKLQQTTNGLNLLHLNIRSLKSNKESLIDLLENCKNNRVQIDVILLCETYVTDYNIHLCQIDGYELHSHSRKNSHGGGVCIFIKSELTHEQLDLNHLFHEKEFEIIGIELKSKHVTVNLYEVYRSPNTDMKIFMKSLKRFLDETSKQRNVVLCGDFNIDLLKANQNKTSSDFLTVLMENKFFPNVVLLTRVTLNSCTLIDNMFVKTNISTDATSSIVETDISDHFPCILSLPGFVIKHDSFRVIEKRIITKESILLSKEELKSVNWSLLDTNDANACYSKFHDTIMRILDKYMPIVKVKRRNVCSRRVVEFLGLMFN